jgi:hypothetical protein
MAALEGRLQPVLDLVFLLRLLLLAYCLVYCPLDLFLLLQLYWDIGRLEFDKVVHLVVVEVVLG